MAEYLIQDTTLQDIADSIRSKTGLSQNILVSNMGKEIRSIIKGITPAGTMNIATNGTYDVTSYASVSVNGLTVDDTSIGAVAATPDGNLSLTITDPNGNFAWKMYAPTNGLVVPENIAAGKTVLGVTGTGELTLPNNYGCIQLANSESYVYQAPEFTGACYLNNNSTSFDITAQAVTCDTGGGTIWQKTTTCVWLPALTPFIIWLPPAATASFPSGITMVDTCGERTIRNAIYRGYRCRLDGTNTVLWWYPTA